MKKEFCGPSLEKGRGMEKRCDSVSTPPKERKEDQQKSGQNSPRVVQLSHDNVALYCNHLCKQLSS